ncbi:hypothetical protein IP92_05739 [Pseudoduganella flava]|uniref:Type IV / VI secretion system DotU domain-containing protein n=1 Tax=Pseudoduganella flava TaxID=871742 RepID=A0A562P9E6_9BURK|nr:hypothetical protein [Pseudoduganella flava]QGZ42728.1 hypothetical protein GO485_29295 [Pseudoduganella flava]TWI41019.1 hypothetical protein IP92_05739 [Pseudoduganella flava]
MPESDEGGPTRGPATGPTTGPISGPIDGDPGRGEILRIEEFIFVRELYEVFLLLDHISGRWDKELRDAHHDAGTDPAQIIHTICEIGLAPSHEPDVRLAQAVALMRAKDTLNAIARPATGMTVAFTILVVGEEDRRKKMNALRRVLRDLFRSDSPADPPPGQRGHGSAMWDKPTRVTLARYAYPGLIGVAIKFNRRMLWLVLFLLSSLALT